ncbi:aldolase/citrate lyase family protein [Actinoallomurus spadix]|uniref:4-hydroxy-2-oxoheptanedioate aldolase n=1 Tax=Actinoallomurus spadix TaxID=79912 RepID=A0ABP3GR55_9ACTN|nr:aldolase/citrate lyase family protein [Actinoallomurus spadix]MCO5989629.1 aldolase/citrate lyase family protein [Actinoallomurus spadix]
MADVTTRAETTHSTLRHRMRSGAPLLVSLQSIPDPAITTILGWSGFDAVILDGEHGPFTLESLRHCLDAVSTTPAEAVVRVRSAEAGLIKQVLELGAAGILAPSISTADEAAALVSACKYPPLGMRGTGTGRAARYGLASRSYRATANDEVVVLAMIETKAGVANAKEIATVEGLDGIFLGPHDLAAELGVDDHDPVITDATRTVVGHGRGAGIAVGSFVPPADVRAAAEAGMTLMMSYTDFAGLAQSSHGAFLQAAEGVAS